MGKAHSQDVAEVAQRDKHGKDADAGAVAKHVLEKHPRDDGVRRRELRLWNRRKIRHVGEHIQDRHPPDGQRRGNGQRAARVADLAEHVVCILPALVAVDDVEQGVGVLVGAAAAVALAALDAEGVLKVLRVRDLAVAGEGGEAGADDEEEHDDLEDAEDVEQADAPLGRDGVERHGEGGAGDADGAAFVRVLELVAGGVEDEAAKGEAVARGEAEEDHLRGEHARGHVLGVAVDVLEVVLFAAGAGDGEAVLEPDAEAGKGQDAADDPEDQADADGACRGKDVGWCREDAGSDHLVEDEEDGAGDAELAVVGVGVGVFLLDLADRFMAVLVCRGHLLLLDGDIVAGGLVRGRHVG